MAKQRLTLDFMPMRGGLATAGQRATINESQLWVTENFYPGLDGMLSRRPGVVQHGQTLTLPSDDATNAFYADFSSLTSWEVVEATGATVKASSGQLIMQMGTVAGTAITRGAGFTSASGNYSAKFTARLTNPSGTDTTGGALYVVLTGDGGTTNHGFFIDADSVRLDAAVDLTIYTPTYKLDLGRYHTYEFYYTLSSDTLDLWVDGVLVTDEFDMSTAANIVSVGTNQTIEFQGTVDADGWTVMITDLMYSDLVYTTAAPPFEAQRVVDVGQYIRKLAGSSTKTYLLAATKNRLYIDESARGAWRPLIVLQSGHTFFVSYREKLMIYDDNGSTGSRLWQWDGSNAPELLEDVPPVRFGAEHRTRLWSAGDRSYPLRAYFTASRQPDVWYAPTYDSDITFEEVTQAGYINIPSDTGDEITGIYGEFLNNAIVRTRQGLWRITGAGPRSFQVENISKQVGGSSPWGATQIGNDLFIVGEYGVISVGTAQQSGNLQTAMPSAPIADIWSSIVNIPDRVDRSQLEHAYFATLPSLNIAVLGMRGQGSDVLDKMFVWSALTQQWIGPWSLNPTCFAKIEHGLPVVDILMHGHTDGRVSLTGLGTVTDMGTGYTAKLASPMFDGRSVDPVLKSNHKKWRTLKLYLLARADEDFTVKWKCDQLGWHEYTQSQNPHDLPALSNDFRLNIDRLHSAHDVTVVEFVLDVRGQYFQFEFETDYDFALQGCQVEFLQGQEED